jgi:hypothetical protein
VVINVSVPIRGVGSRRFQDDKEPFLTCSEMLIPGCIESVCEKLDLIFVVDVTASMETLLASIVNDIETMIEWVEQNAPDYQMGMRAFRDEVTDTVLLAELNANAVKAALQNQLASGGGFVEEASDIALEDAYNDTGWRADAMKIIILITDAPPGGDDDFHTAADVQHQYDVAADCAAANISVSTVFALTQELIDQFGQAYIDFVQGILEETARQGQGVFVSTYQEHIVPVLLGVLDDICEGAGGGISPTDGCCIIGPCTFCVEVMPDPIPPATETRNFKVIAEWDREEGWWLGIAGPVTWKAYWKVQGTCYFFIEVNGVVVSAEQKCSELYSGGTLDCRNINGSARYGIASTDYGEGNRTEGLVTWEIIRDQQLMRVPFEGDLICPPIDIIFVLDITGSMGNVLSSIVAGFDDIIDWLDANAPDYQLGLRTFRDSIVDTVNLTPQNGVAMKATIAALVASAGNLVPEASDIALESARLDPNWRGPLVNKLMILVTDAPPGGLDDTFDNVDRDNQYQTATDGLAAGIITSTVYAVTSTPVSFYRDILRETASRGGGEFVETSDTSVLANSFIDFMADLCRAVPLGMCSSLFCEDCECTCENLCVSVSFQNGEDQDACIGHSIVPFTGDLCEDGIRASEAIWSGPVQCAEHTFDFVFELKSDPYTGICYIEGTVEESAISFSATLQPVTGNGCFDIEVAWTVLDSPRTLTVHIECLRCGECGPPPFLDPCCPETVVPNLEATIRITGLDPSDLPPYGLCEAEYVIPLNFGGLTGNGGGGVDTPSCPGCCEDGNPIGFIFRSTSPEEGDPDDAEFWYHGGGQVTIGGAPFSLCVISCSCADALAESTGCDHLPEEDPDDPATARMVYQVTHRESNTSWCVCAMCGDLDSPSLDFTDLLVDYCPNSAAAGATLTVEITEV